MNYAPFVDSSIQRGPVALMALICGSEPEPWGCAQLDDLVLVLDRFQNGEEAPHVTALALGRVVVSLVENCLVAAALEVEPVRETHGVWTKQNPYS